MNSKLGPLLAGAARTGVRVGVAGGGVGGVVLKVC